jgi:hypothetical protein
MANRLENGAGHPLVTFRKDAGRFQGRGTGISPVSADKIISECPVPLSHYPDEDLRILEPGTDAGGRPGNSGPPLVGRIRLRNLLSAGKTDLGK